MSDIFLSYAREDRGKAELLAEHFSRQGWRVWWDSQIPVGRSFDETIEQALSSARCVVVLWSQSSVASRWVRTEAAEGLARGILVPVLIEQAPIPLEFKRVEAADLSDWEGGSSHPELEALSRTVAGLLSGSPPSEAKPIASPTVSRRRPWWKTPLIFVAAAAGFVTLVLLTAVALLRSGILDRVDRRAPVADEASARINLLAPENGGHLVMAPSEEWARTIDGREATSLISWDVDARLEAVYAFKDKRPATFHTFTLFIPAAGENVKEFELLVANDLSPESFESIGRFQTQNMRLFEAPQQPFEFPAVKARFLKIRLISSYSSRYVLLSDFQLFGRLEEE